MSVSSQEMNTSFTMDTGTEEMLCEVDQGVALVTLNKPHKKNALGDKLTPALRALLPVLETDPRVGCVLLTGAGDAFCAGGDVSEMGQGSAATNSTDRAQAPTSAEQRIATLTEKQMELTHRLYHLKKITIAALPGAAAGAGLSIALACDLRVGSERAFITTAFRNIGLSGDYGASWFLSRLVGLGRAKALFYSSERLDAVTCEQWGLLNAVFKENTFREDSLDYAKKIAQGPRQALAFMKENLQAGFEQSLESSLALEAQHLIECSGTAESKEAIRAFIEKRPPDFSV